MEAQEAGEKVMLKALGEVGDGGPLLFQRCFSLKGTDAAGLLSRCRVGLGGLSAEAMAAGHFSVGWGERGLKK